MFEMAPRLSHRLDPYISLLVDQTTISQYIILISFNWQVTLKYDNVQRQEVLHLLFFFYMKVLKNLARFVVCHFLRRPQGNIIYNRVCLKMMLRINQEWQGHLRGYSSKIKKEWSGQQGAQNQGPSIYIYILLLSND